MGYVEDSAAQQQRIKDRKRKAGESQTDADTRAAAGRVKTSVFVPASIREANWRTGRNPYRGKDAKRMASFQSSTAGQRMGLGGTMSDPFGERPDFTTGNSRRPSLPRPDPIQLNSPSPVAAPVLPHPSKQTAPTAKPTLALPGNVAANSPQANFLANKGNMTPEQIAEAHAYAKKMGTTFDEKTGYSREAFNNAPKNPSTTLPAPTSRADAIAAGEERMQGYRDNKANGLPMSADAIAATKAPSPYSRKAVDAKRPDAVLPDPTPAATSAKLIGDSALPIPKSVKPVKKVLPLYTGGEMAEQAVVKQVEKAATPKPKQSGKTELKLDPRVKETAKEVVDTVKAKAAPNIERTKKNLDEMPDRIAGNVADAKKSTSEAIDKVKNLPGVRQVREYLAAADQRKSVSDLNRRMKHKLSAGDLSSADITRYKKLAKEGGVKFDAIKGFYR